MQNYFENELTSVEKEVRWLKTTAIKSGTTITSGVQTINFSIPLTLVSPTNANGTKRFILETEDECIFNATLDVYFDDIANAHGDTRRRTVQQYYIENNKYVINILAFGDSNDRDTLSGGGSVNISGKLTITCTGSFNLEEL